MTIHVKRSGQGGNGKQVAACISYLVDENPGPAGQESDATALLLARCLEGLSDAQRRSLRLAYAGGRSQEEIAVEMASPLGSVKSWIRRALLQLRECMES